MKKKDSSYEKIDGAKEFEFLVHPKIEVIIIFLKITDEYIALHIFIRQRY